MRTLLCLILSISTVATGCGDDSGAVDTGMPPVDGGSDTSTPPVDGGDDTSVPPTDGGMDSATDAMTDAGGGLTCGDGRPDISGINGTEGAIVARDGTIYYTRSGEVGRLVPGGSPETFVTLTGAGTVWGLALDASNENLYVGVPGDGVYHIDTTDPGAGATEIASGGQPNGLTVGPDGFVYYSDFGGGAVRRVDPAGGAPETVTTSSISGANGVAFDSDGTLLVCSYGTGILHRLTLTDGVETGRAEAASGLGSPDGVALDEDGLIYVTDNSGRLLRVEAGGAITELATGIPNAASLDFGSGALSCSDIYVASGGTMARYEMGTARGADVLWH